MAERRLIAGVPCHEASLAPAPGGPAEGVGARGLVEQLAPLDLLAAGLDELLAGGVAPRSWLLLHEPGQAALGAGAALMLARALAARGQNVLVLDIDEAQSVLTGWAGRAETEGWIDVVRFGASVAAACAPLPLGAGRGRLLGVGSFTPTDATEDEIAALLSRLRHQADDILLTGPVGPAVLPWARRAERRLFCWDRTDRREAELERVLEPLAAAQVPVTGILGWGPEPISAVEPPPAEAGAPMPSVPPPAPAAPMLDELAPLDGEAEPARRHRRLFWLAAGAFGAAIMASAWYWTNHVRVPPGGFFEPVATREGPAVPVADESPPRTAHAGGLASPEDSLPAASDAATAAPEPAAVPARPQSPTPAAGSASFDPAPYAGPVGGDGWALHVYSLADSASAAEQVRALADQGFQAAVRIVEIREKGGRWWRVYVGSFPTRAAAAAAMPALLGRLGTHWAEPARFRESSP
ncbi:SPOR domain-containing protein [bacterium]|nr:SPOR domain-containing protein [bacterium]